MKDVALRVGEVAGRAGVHRERLDSPLKGRLYDRAEGGTRLVGILEERIVQATRQIATLTRLREELEGRCRALSRVREVNHGRGYGARLEATGPRRRARA